MFFLPCGSPLPLLTLPLCGCEYLCIINKFRLAAVLGIAAFRGRNSLPLHKRKAESLHGFIFRLWKRGSSSSPHLRHGII